MKKILLNYFKKEEIILWCSSVILIVVSFAIFDRGNYVTLAASIIGVTSLIFNAKGNPFGQVLMIIFSALYGMISWLNNPYQENRAEVKVNHIKKTELIFMWILAVMVTIVFYFILEYFNTANMIPSTISVTTSFVAVYLTFRRSPYYAIGYAANDVVLIVLWVMASLKDTTYISVVVCFVSFLANDIYGYLSWSQMGKRQTIGQKS